MYIKRHMEQLLEQITGQYPVLLVTGPRQVGKTTMLEHLAQKEGRGRETVTLDDLTIIRISYLGRGMGLKKELADGVSLSALFFT